MEGLAGVFRGGGGAFLVGLVVLRGWGGLGGGEWVGPEGGWQGG